MGKCVDYDPGLSNHVHSEQTENVLIVILAETRAHELTFPSFKSHLLDIYGADLALCVARNPREDPGNPFYAHAKYVWACDEPDDWGEAFDKAQQTIAAAGDWRRLLEIKDQWLGGIKGDHAHPGSAGILLYFRWFLKQCLINEDVVDRYDRFIVTRSDFMHLVPAPPMGLLAPEKIWIPYGEAYGGYTDRHILASREQILSVLSIADPILEEPDILYRKMAHAKNWNLERYIKFAFAELGLESLVGFYPYTMYSVRTEMGHTRWGAGTYDETLGYYVKYPSELRRARLAARFINKSGQWNWLNKWVLMRLVGVTDWLNDWLDRQRNRIRGLGNLWNRVQ